MKDMSPARPKNLATKTVAWPWDSAVSIHCKHGRRIQFSLHPFRRTRQPLQLILLFSCYLVWNFGYTIKRCSLYINGYQGMNKDEKKETKGTYTFAPRNRNLGRNSREDIEYRQGKREWSVSIYKHKRWERKSRLQVFHLFFLLVFFGTLCIIVVCVIKHYV